MDKTPIPGVIPSVVAISAAIIAVWGQLRVKRVEAQLALQKVQVDQRAKTEQTARQFREPLVRAAYELQSRIFNIVRSGFAEAYISESDDRRSTHCRRSPKVTYFFLQRRMRSVNEPGFCGNPALPGLASLLRSVPWVVQPLCVLEVATH
jgi:hypothetical protein